MSVRRLAAEQPEGFAFTPENLEWAKAQIKKYPEGREASAVLPILWRAQEQMGGWLPEPALRYVADMLKMAYIRIYEIATFYTMFNLAPVGRYYVQVCGTTPCWLRGANEIKDTCRKLIGEPGHVTQDGLFSWTEVECLGACVNAPMAQINKDYYEDLTPESLEWILTNLKAGREVVPGPQNGRQSSESIGGPITLTDPELYRNEEQVEESALVGASLTDRGAKRPGKSANQREAAVPKPPLGRGRKPRSQ
jgi:NADH-quinone oxidoreductase subunit E